jgi:hypothetical protein
MRTLALTLAVGILSLPAITRAAGPEQRSNPYVSLFRGQLEGKPAPPSSPAIPLPPLVRAATPSNAPIVVCGMTILPADPKSDARMLVPVPKNNAKPSIRTISPTACRR